MFKTNVLKTKLALASVFALALTAGAYCLHLQTPSGTASGGSEFGHLEVGSGDSARSCEVWFCSNGTPRTLRFYAGWRDTYNVWHDAPGTPFTLTNTLTGNVVIGGFTPCDNAYALQAWIQEGTITRAVSNWY